MTNEVYIELTAAKDKFCILEDTCAAKLIKGPFDTVKEAEDWANNNGYKINKYVNGKLTKDK